MFTGCIYHDGGGLWNDTQNVLNHNGNNQTVETYPGMGRHKVPAIFVHGARNVTIDGCYWNDTQKPCCGGSAMACRDCAMPDPKQPDRGYYNGHAYDMHELAPGAQWPAAAQTIIARAGRRV